ncbi:hypothetical protein HAX54_036501 [Datura stramonium]|uniref:Uncharacterized protein n=1 Tax=Datura stramonium TaxID=4076 RepID=A0ABS8VGZ6_DATST|nr:hypothetical protein [Datura stramonium]
MTNLLENQVAFEFLPGKVNLVLLTKGEVQTATAAAVQWQVCMHGEEPGRKDVNRILTHQKFKAPRELSRNQVPQTGALTESKEGTSNILQSEAEIIEGFITALGTREKDVGEESPSAEGRRLGSDVSNCPFIHESGEPSSQEALPIVASPKCDGTPINQTWGSRGTVKKSLDLILEESRQNTLKRRRVTRQTVLDEEAPYSPIVDLDFGTPSQPTEESPKTEKKAHCSGGVSKKGKKLVVVEKPTEGPGAPVLRSKRKHVIAKSSKGKHPSTAIVGDDVKAWVANIRKQKRWGTEEIERLIMLVAKKYVEIEVLKASQSSTVPGALLDLQEENARLKSANASLRKQLEELTQQMIRDQRATNERIDKLLAKL